jgi:hypothetical protein
MNPLDVVIWMFLGIFLLTALIELASLVGWVRMPDFFKKKLFNLLIVEVVVCITGFAGQAVTSYLTSQPNLGTILLSQDYDWDWQYAEKGWRSRLRFEPVGDGKMKFIGDTYLVDRGGNQPPVIIKWESIEAFAVPVGAKLVKFAARRTWTQAAADAYPALRWEVGKSTEIEITLKIGPALCGSATDCTSAKAWGLMLTPAFPR